MDNKKGKTTVKSKKSHHTCVIWKVKCSCGEEYIGKTERNVSSVLCSSLAHFPAQFKRNQKYSIICRNGTLDFSSQAREIKEIHPRKRKQNFLIFWEMEFLKHKLKKICNISGGDLKSVGNFLIFNFFSLEFSLSELSLSESSKEIYMSSVINLVFFFPLKMYLHSSKNTWG